MGNIAKRPDGKWRARYRDPSGRERSKHFDRKLDAQRWLAEVEVSKNRGLWVDPVLGRLSVDAWSRTFLEGLAHLKPSTRERYVVALRAHILPTFGNVPLARVAYTDVATWVQGLIDKGLSPATVRYAHRVLSLLLDNAVKDGRLTSNPAAGVRLPRVVTSERRFLTVDEVERLAEHAEPYSILIRVLAYTGLRWGEAAALRARRVDLSRRRIEVAEATAEVRGKVVVGTPKNHQRRSVPVPRFLVDELASALYDKASDDLVFTAPGGGFLRNTNFRHRVFDRAAAAAGLSGLTPHELRHTAASLAVAAGANVKAVQRMLGHSSAAMTLDVYAGLFGDDLDDLADGLDRLRRAGSAD